jgi:hypothetical protein
VCADHNAKMLLDRLLTGTIPDDGLRPSADQPFTHSRIWLPGGPAPNPPMGSTP